VWGNASPELLATLDAIADAIDPSVRAGSVSDVHSGTGAVAHRFRSEIACARTPASAAGLVPTRASSTECDSVSSHPLRQLHQADEVAVQRLTRPRSDPRRYDRCSAPWTAAINS